MILIPIDTISIRCQYDIAITLIRRPRDVGLDIDDDSGGIGRQGVIKNAIVLNRIRQMGQQRWRYVIVIMHEVALRDLYASVLRESVQTAVRPSNWSSVHTFTSSIVKGAQQSPNKLKHTLVQKTAHCLTSL